jgi:hypothetical protein
MNLAFKGWFGSEKAIEEAQILCFAMQVCFDKRYMHIYVQTNIKTFRKYQMLRFSTQLPCIIHGLNRSVTG